MPELVTLHGPKASLNYRCGEVVAEVEVPFVGHPAVDFERNRLKLDALGGPERDRWVSGGGLLLVARSGWWGVTLVSDLLPQPPEARLEPVALEPADRLRKSILPRDLASCPRCKTLVVIRRDRSGRGYWIGRPTKRVARRARELMKRWGLMDFVADSLHGRGHEAGKPHTLDCYDLPVFKPFTEGRPAKRGRGRPRVEKPFLGPMRKPFERKRRSLSIPTE